MNVYVWQRVQQCSDNYHPEGGVVVFAATEARARELANEKPGCHISTLEVVSETRHCSGGEEAVYIFPDAGCC